MADSSLHLASECRVCGTALSGPGGALVRLAGIRRSLRNPNVCTRCNTHIEAGEIREVTVLFADLSGFTALTHELGPIATHALVETFLEGATAAVVAEDGGVDKYIGDAVMAVFNEPIIREDHAAAAFRAALAIQSAMPSLSERSGRPLRATVGVARGHARIGPMGGRGGREHTLLGDVVNLAARLQSQARPGEILVDEGVYQDLQGAMGTVLQERLVLKGFPDPIPCRRFGPEGQLPPPAEVAPRRRRFLGIGSVALALLGAPCASAAAISPLALWLGLGSVAGAAGAGTPTGLDHPWVRIPLMMLSGGVALVNLVAVHRASHLRRAREGAKPLPASPLDRRRAAWAVGLSLLTLLVVLMELAMHARMHPHG